MGARSVRRTHPGVAHTLIPYLRRPREVPRPRGAHQPSPDVTLIAQMVLDMRDAHALDERIDRLVERVVTGLQARDVPVR